MHRRTATTLAVTVLAGLLATGCAATPTAVSDTAPTGTQPLTTPSSEPPKSPRGHLIKQVGEKAGLVGRSGEQIATFTLTSITPDAECQAEYGMGGQLKNGHLLVIEATASTTKDYPPQLRWSLNPHGFSVIGPDGVTETNVATLPAHTCVPNSERLPTTHYSPASNYEGTIALDVPASHGTLIYQPAGSTTLGWEWKF